VQRDWQVDAGIEPAAEEDAVAVRERAAAAIQAVFEELGLPPVTDAEVVAATYGYTSRDLADRDRGADAEAAARPVAERTSAAGPSSSRSAEPPRAVGPTGSSAPSGPPSEAACAPPATASRTRECSTRSARGSGSWVPSPGSCASAARPTSPSSPTTAPCSPA